MKRILQGQGLNSPQEYDKIFVERTNKGVNWADKRRWKYLLKYYKGGRIADFGCLDSLVLPMARKKYPMDCMVGFDLASKSIEFLGTVYPSILWAVGNIYNLMTRNGYFDYIVMGEVLEHLELPKVAIAEAMRVLAPGGVLAISVPLEEEREPGAVDGHRHLYSFSKQDFQEMLGKYGEVKFKVLRSKWFPRYRYCFPQLICYLFKS